MTKSPTTLIGQLMPLDPKSPGFKKVARSGVLLQKKP